MSRSVVLIVCAPLVACGGGDTPADSDAAPDGPPPDAVAQACFGEFGAWAPVPGLMTDDHELGARLSPDELTVFFQLTRSGSGQGEIAIARRAGVDDPFGEPEVITAVSTDVRELSPTVTADGLTLVFTRWDQEEELWMSGRAAIDDDFAPPGRLDALGSARQALLTPDGSRLWFATDQGIFVASRVGDTYRDPVSANLPVDAYHYPTPSDDGRAIYYTNIDGNTVLRAERSLVTDPWGAPTEVAIPSGPFPSPVRVPTWLSPDGCRLYLYGNGPASTDVYMATRAP